MYWRDDMDPDRRNELMKSLEESGYPSGVREEDTDPEKIPAGIWLVGDQGVYLMSNAPIEEVKAHRENHVAYAVEVDPTKMQFDSWWRAKGESFGSDDGCDFIDEKTLKEGLLGDTFEIDLTPSSMAILIPADTPSP